MPVESSLSVRASVRWISGRRVGALGLLVSLACVGRATHARPLDERELRNLVAFARVTGYVRYFYPTKAVEQVDWELLTAGAIRDVEAARSPEDLGNLLARLYPIAKVSPTGAFARRVVRWEHVGGPREPPLDSGSRLVTRWRMEPWGRISCLVLALLAVLAAARMRRPILVLGVVVALPATLHRQPLETFSAAIDEGLTWTMPLELPESIARMQPTFVAPDREPSPRERRIASVIKVWNVMQHFYPYFEQVDVDWPAALRRAIGKAAVDADDRAFLETLRALAHDLRDSHAVVRQFGEEELAWLPLGFGWVEEKLVVVRTATSIESIVPGDVVLKINGQPTREFIASRVALTPGATESGAWYHAVVFLSNGPDGASMSFTMETGETMDFVFGEWSFPPPRYAPIADVGPGLLRVDLARIDSKAFREALPRMEKARGIVFALHTYPHGFPEPTMLQHLVDRPIVFVRHELPVVRWPDRLNVEWLARPPTTYEALEPLEPRLRGTIAFTTSPLAMSYSEHVLDAVQYYELGKVAGEPTSGSFGEFYQIKLPGNIVFNWTATRSLRLDGSDLHGRGIIPDVPAHRTIRGVREGRDEVLEAAIATISAP